MEAWHRGARNGRQLTHTHTAETRTKKALGVIFVMAMVAAISPMAAAEPWDCIEGVKSQVERLINGEAGRSPEGDDSCLGDEIVWYSTAYGPCLALCEGSDAPFVTITDEMLIPQGFVTVGPKGVPSQTTPGVETPPFSYDVLVGIWANECWLRSPTGGEVLTIQPALYAGECPAPLSYPASPCNVIGSSGIGDNRPPPCGFFLGTGLGGSVGSMTLLPPITTPPVYTPPVVLPSEDFNFGVGNWDREVPTVPICYAYVSLSVAGIPFVQGLGVILPCAG